jgi:hypothetical protein
MGDDRGAAGHRLDHHQAERLGPIPREEQGEGARQKLGLGRVADLADEFHERQRQKGTDLLLEVVSVYLVQRAHGLRAGGGRAAGPA